MVRSQVGLVEVEREDGQMVAPNLKPLANYLMVDRDTTQTMTKGGLFIPFSAQHKSWTGTVVATGPGRVTRKGIRVPVCVAPGDRILFERFAGTMFKLGEKNYWIMHESEVLCGLDESIGMMDLV